MVAQQENAINGLLNQVLDQQARARLNTIRVAKPDKGKQLESIIVQMATSGQVGGKLSENDLIGILERVNAQTQKKTTVKVKLYNIFPTFQLLFTISFLPQYFSFSC
ncbi:UNVERIFIED_CONTAM: hypothetical protein GTU68_014927 [Idotea baltica]|nr:hypothetical protein [Idotea baltica]